MYCSYVDMVEKYVIKCSINFYLCNILLYNGLFDNYLLLLLCDKLLMLVIFEWFNSGYFIYCIYFSILCVVCEQFFIYGVIIIDVIDVIIQVVFDDFIEVN